MKMMMSNKRNCTNNQFGEIDTEAMISCVTNIIEDIVRFYQITWQRDRELGYPGYHVALAKPTSSVDERVNLQQKEIARLNTILPKLEESYITKLRDCWSTLVLKLRQMSKKNPQNFKRLVANVQIHILTHKIHSRMDIYSISSNSNNISLRNQDIDMIQIENFSRSMQ